MSNVDSLGQYGVDLSKLNPPVQKISKNQNKSSVSYNVNKRSIVSVNGSAIKIAPNTRSEIAENKKSLSQSNLSPNKNNIASKSGVAKLAPDQLPNVHDIDSTKELAPDQNNINPNLTRDEVLRLVSDQNIEVKDNDSSNSLLTPNQSIIKPSSDNRLDRVTPTQNRIEKVDPTKLNKVTPIQNRIEGIDSTKLEKVTPTQNRIEKVDPTRLEKVAPTQNDIKEIDPTRLDRVIETQNKVEEVDPTRLDKVTPIQNEVKEIDPTRLDRVVETQNKVEEVDPTRLDKVTPIQNDVKEIDPTRLNKVVENQNKVEEVDPTRLDKVTPIQNDVKEIDPTRLNKVVENQNKVKSVDDVSRVLPNNQSNANKELENARLLSDQSRDSIEVNNYNVVPNQNIDNSELDVHKVAPNQNNNIFRVFRDKLLEDQSIKKNPHGLYKLPRYDLKFGTKNIIKKLLNSAVGGLDRSLYAKFGTDYELVKKVILDKEPFNPIGTGLSVLGIREVSVSDQVSKLVDKMLGNNKIHTIIKASDKKITLQENSNKKWGNYKNHINFLLGYNNSRIQSSISIFNNNNLITNPVNLIGKSSNTNGSYNLNFVYHTTKLNSSRFSLFDGTKWVITMHKLGALTPEVPYSKMFDGGFQPAVDFKLSTFSYNTDPVDLSFTELNLPSESKLSMDLEITLVNDAYDTVNEYIRNYRKFMYGSNPVISGSKNSFLYIPSYRKLVTIINIYLLNPQGEFRRSLSYDNSFNGRTISKDKITNKQGVIEFAESSPLRYFVNYYSLLCIPKLGDESISYNVSNREHTVTLNYSIVGVTNFLPEHTFAYVKTKDIGVSDELYKSGSFETTLKGLRNLSKF